MGKNEMIIAENVKFSLDCFETNLNNNVLVVGASGSGKTRSVVIPNLLQATGSYVISDPKGNLYNKYGAYLRGQGYDVKILDFTEPNDSAHYNFFKYIRRTQDINKIAHMLMRSNGEKGYTADPFWDDADELLLQSVIGFLFETCGKEDKNLSRVQDLVSLCRIDEEDSGSKTPLDILMEEYEEENKDSYAVRQYKKFRIAAGKTLKSILITLNAKIGLYDTPEIREMTANDTINITEIGDRPTAIFVAVSDTDRSLDGLVNLFFTQAMNELCYYADKHCKGNTLPISVRFILDDFATNCKIEEFPRMISSIRSRGISTMLMIQAESQLKQGYNHDAKTIIANCDTYVYLGGNDIDTAEAVAKRCDIPLKKVLYMPVGTNWIFRRGQAPINGTNFKIGCLLKEKALEER